MDICAGQDGIYMVYLSGDNKTLYGFRYNASGITSLGSWVGQGDMLANPSIAVEDGRVCVLYQDRNRRYVRTYDAGANSWKDLLSETCTTSGGMLRFYNGSLYMLKNEAGGSYLCRYEPDGSWKQLGDAYATCSVSDFDLVFMGESPCVLYFDGSAGQLKGTQLLDGAWVPMGGYISNGETVTGPRLHTDGKELYAVYLTNTSEQILLKAYTPKEAHTHFYGGWTVTTAPTCTQPGSEKRTCSLCGCTETRTIAAKGHSWNSTVTVDTPAAYSHPGSQSIHCKNCDATKNVTVIPAKPNPFEDVKPRSEGVV